MDKDEANIYYLEIPTGSKAYFHYDSEHGTVECGGKAITMPEARLIDFIHTAETLGLGAGRM